MPNSTNIRELDLSSEKDAAEQQKYISQITNLFLKYLSESHNLCSIKRLNLRGTLINDEGIIKFISSYNCEYLQDFKISWNKEITNKALIYIADHAESKLPMLNKLYVNDTNID